MSEKLQKVLAQAGLGSRREMEQWIQDGRVKVNGEVAKLGDRVEPTDRIEVDGRPLRQDAPVPKQVIMYYKPVGEVCSRQDDANRPLVFDHLPKLASGRWISVGRLDVNTSGLLLFTTDGELANRLMHPSYQIERQYAVRVLGEVDDEMLQRLTEGVELEDGPARFDEVVRLSEGAANEWFRVTLREGRKREVRRLWESQGLKVSRLIRIRFGPVTLPRGLHRGGILPLSAADTAALYRLVGLTPPSEPRAPNRSAGRGARAGARTRGGGKRSPNGGERGRGARRAR